ncbi:MAG TPA: invasion associated locus B family protein [Xanthobacteraceae bacterium]|nr:invasion associated locus B family protein [Xanthobacteraceae bacterium]
MSVRHTFMILAAGLALIVDGTLPASTASAQRAEPTLMGQFGAWGAYVAAPGGKKTCFALSKPTSSKTEPPNRPRDTAHLFISTRPGEKVINEVFVQIGYPLKTDAASSIDVGGVSHNMYAEGDGLWIKTASEEGQLVDALRRGNEAVVNGTSSRGTKTTDVFSLRGLTQALDRVAQECSR